MSDATPLAAPQAESASFAAGTAVIEAKTEAAAAIEIARAADTQHILSKVEEKLSEHHADNKREMKNMLLDVLGNIFGPEESTYVIKNRVPLLCQSVSSMKESIIKIQTMLEELPEEMDKKYAGKLTEKIVYGLVASILFGVIGTVGAAIIFFLKK